MCDLCGTIIFFYLRKIERDSSFDLLKINCDTFRIDGQENWKQSSWKSRINQINNEWDIFFRGFE